MISDELNQIIEQINNQGSMRLIDAATSEQITQFEVENDIHLPSKYKEWLLLSDGGELYLPAGVQLYGVAHKPLIDLNDNDRPDNSYIVIGALASGDPILCKEDEERIYVYDHENRVIAEELMYEDFFAFTYALYDLLGIGE